jgi:hypothetical protein
MKFVHKVCPQKGGIGKSLIGKGWPGVTEVRILAPQPIISTSYLSKSCEQAVSSSNFSQTKKIILWDEDKR